MVNEDTSPTMVVTGLLMDLNIPKASGVNHLDVVWEQVGKQTYLVVFFLKVLFLEMSELMKLNSTYSHRSKGKIR